MSSAIDPTRPSPDWGTGAAFIAGLILVLAILLGVKQDSIITGHKQMEQQAVLHHAAHYEPDTKGNPVFVWNTPATSTP